MRRRWFNLLFQYPLIVCCSGWGLLFWWNGSVAVAIAVGSIMAVVVYLSQIDRLYVDWNSRISSLPFNHLDRDQHHGQFLGQFLGQSYRQDIQTWFIQWFQHLRQDCWPKLWLSSNRALSVSLLAGGVTIALVTLVNGVLLIFQETQSVSLTVIVGGQCLSIVALGGYIGWQQWQMRHPLTGGMPDSVSEPVLERSFRSDTSSDAVSSPCSQLADQKYLDVLLADLASNHPPTRLIAVYRVVHWVQYSKSDMVNVNLTNFMACFRLMLAHERQPTVQQALREALMTLQEQVLVLSVHPTDELG